MEREIIAAESFISAFQALNIDRSRPIIAHASLSAFGEVQGGAESLLEALLQVYEVLIMPGFTYKTMVVPEEGPHGNGLLYGSYRDANRMVEIFHPEMPVDRLMGVIPEALRLRPGTRRSQHPILSFVGMNAERYLESQTLDEPLEPIRLLAESQGWVLLLGVDHTVSTSIHLSERLAGRKQFLRWALTQEGIVECPRFPGCSDGFNELASRLIPVTRQASVGQASICAIPLLDLVETAKAWLEIDPLALLCDRSYCERCQAIRDFVTEAGY